MAIPAGNTVQVQSTGTRAYFVVCSAPVNARPKGGDFVLYQQGTGIDTGTVIFQGVEIQNPNAVPVVISMFVGFAGFIDNRLIIADAITPNVAYPTYPVASAGTVVNIPDLSGGPFTDINGVGWYAISRNAILVFNADSGVTYNLQRANATAAGDPSIGVIYPLTPIQFQVSGNYRITKGGAPINVVVSEIYTAILAPNT